MITFTYNRRPSRKEPGVFYIDWNCTWDGRHDNEPLLADYNSSVGHPFAQLSAYKDDEYYFTNFEKYSHVINDKEEVNPANLREIGNVVADNPVTRALCEALASKNIDSGSTVTYFYYLTLLQCLDLLWD